MDKLRQNTYAKNLLLSQATFRLFRERLAALQKDKSARDNLKNCYGLWRLTVTRTYIRALPPFALKHYEPRPETPRYFYP